VVEDKVTRPRKSQPGRNQAATGLPASRWIIQEREGGKEVAVTSTLERPTAEHRAETDLLEREQVRRVEERPTREVLPPKKKASPFVRWLAWIVGIVLIAGTAGLIWWAVTTPEDLVAPAIESIDPHESPEILRIQVPELVAPSIQSIDPHESPEILRIPEVVAPSIESIDPHESPEILRIPEAVAPSTDAWSLQTMALIQSMSPQFRNAWSLQTMELLQSMSPQSTSAWSLQTMELLQSMSPQSTSAWSLQTLQLLRSMPPSGD
jgi:hypothetical protein